MVNSRLREIVGSRSDIKCIFSPLKLCGDNGAMIASVAYYVLEQEATSLFTTTAFAIILAMTRHKTKKN